MLSKLSCTSLKIAKRCEKQLFFKLTQPKPAKTAPALLIGIVFHEVVAEYLKQKKALKNGMTIKQLEVTFGQKWEQMRGSGDWERMDENKAQFRCWAYLQTYFHKRLNLMFCGIGDRIERLFTFIAKEVGFGRSDGASNGTSKIEFVGKIDFLGLDNAIYDHKTSSGKWTQANADAEPQAHIYPIALQANGIPANRFFFNVVTEKEVNVFEVVPKREVFDSWIRYGFELQRNYPDNLLPTNNAKICKFCDWKNICPDFKAE